MRQFLTLLAVGLAALGLALDDYAVKSTWYQTSFFDAGCTAVTGDGINNVYAASYALTTATSGDVYLRKVNSAGSTVWNKNVLSGLQAPIRILRIVLDSSGNPYLLVRSTFGPSKKPTLSHLKVLASTGAVTFTTTYPGYDPRGIAVIGNGGAGTKTMVVYQQSDPNNSTSKRWALLLRVEGETTTFTNGPSYDGSSMDDVVAGTDGRFYTLQSGNNLVISARVTTAPASSTPIIGSGGFSGGRLSWNPATGEIGAVAVHNPNTTPSAFRIRAIGTNLGGYTADVGALNGSPSGLVFRPDGSLLYFAKLLAGNASTFYSYTGGTTSGIGTLTSGYDADSRGVALDSKGVLHFASMLINPQGAASTLNIHGLNGSKVYSYVWQLTNSQPHAIYAAPNGSVYVAAQRLYYSNIPADAGVLIRLLPKAIAENDEFQTPRDKTLNVSSPGCLANDFGTIGATISYGNAQHGTFTPGSAGAYTYMPDPGYSGQDTVQYSLTKDSLVDTGVVRIYVQPRLLNLTAPASVSGGEPANATLSLTSNQLWIDAIVSLSDNSTAVALPTSVSVPVGQSQKVFPITTVPVTSDRNATITATLYGETKTASLQILTPRPSSVILNPNSLIGGEPFSGTVTLSGKAPAGGIVVSLTDSGEYITVPVSVTVAAGSKSVAFTGTTAPRSASLSRSVTASANGANASGSLTLNPGGLNTVSATPATLKGGVSTTGKVTTAGDAPISGIVVGLSTTGGNVTVPPSVTVAGTNQATFAISTTAVATTVTRTITAQWAGVVRTTSITLTP